jgi:GH15 family glucan-1,4-alpha-glucosidase
MVVLRGSRLPHAVGTRHEDEFDVSAGQQMTFTMTWFRLHHSAPAPLGANESVGPTIAHWDEGAARCVYDGPYRESVVRSLLVLRILTDRETGGIVAAPTTSLPEQFGGSRNWDYRYCWLRDASLTLEALLRSGYQDETALWRNWLLRAVAGDPEDMQIMYAVDGSRNLPEKELSHLGGYENSRPVRIGNEAVGQLQTDVLGEVMIALALARQQGLEDSPESWALQLALIRNLCDHWTEPDNGLWEFRNQLRYFTHSRVMVWVAFDRAIKAVEQQWLQGPVQKWRELRTKVYDEVMSRGTTRRRVVSPSITTQQRWTPHFSCCPASGSCPRTTPGSWEPSAPSSRSSCSTASCCATAPTRDWTACQATSIHSWPVPSGWSVPTP